MALGGEQARLYWVLGRNQTAAPASITAKTRRAIRCRAGSASQRCRQPDPVCLA